MTNNPEIRVLNSAGTATENDNLWKKTVEDTLITKANVDLANLSTIGQAKFNSKASVSLDNLNTTGELRFSSKANTSLNNLDATGEARFGNLLKVPSEVGETFTTEFPLKADRANKYMLFDEEGNVGVGTGGGGGGGDVSSSISSTTDGKVAVFDGITGKLIKDTTITGMLKATSGVLSQAISDTDYVSNSRMTTLEGMVNGLSSSKANLSLNNLDATGEARFTEKANTSLSNLDSTGQAIIDGKLNITSLKGYIYGLVTGYSSANVYSISSGICLSSDNTTLIELSSMTKSVSSFAIGAGNGSLDSGTIANSTWYYVYAIYNPTTKVSDVLMSTSYPTPTLPSGFTKYRFIDAIYYANATLLFGYKFYGDKRITHQIDSAVAGLTTVGGTPLTVSGLLFPSKCGCLLNVQCRHTTVGVIDQILLDSGANTPITIQVLNFDSYLYQPFFRKLLILSNTANSNLRVTTGGNFSTLRITVSEFEIIR